MQAIVLYHHQSMVNGHCLFVCLFGGTQWWHFSEMTINGSIEVISSLRLLCDSEAVEAARPQCRWLTSSSTCCTATSDLVNEQTTALFDVGCQVKAHFFVVMWSDFAVNNCQVTSTMRSLSSASDFCERPQPWSILRGEAILSHYEAMTSYGGGQAAVVSHFHGNPTASSSEKERRKSCSIATFGRKYGLVGATLFNQGHKQIMVRGLFSSLYCSSVQWYPWRKCILVGSS